MWDGMGWDGEGGGLSAADSRVPAPTLSKNTVSGQGTELQALVCHSWRHS